MRYKMLDSMPTNELHYRHGIDDPAAPRGQGQEQKMEQYFTVEPSINGKYHNVVFHAARAFADGATGEYFTALGTSAKRVVMSVEPAGNGTYVIDDAAMTTHPDFDSAVAAAKAALVNRT